MGTCDCKAVTIDLLQVAKFEPIKQIIKDKGLRHVNDQSSLMFCSPVGNQKLFGSEVKANVVLSGFCVAPDAAISFAEDLQRSSFKKATVDNAFNTSNMRSGIKKIFKSIGIKKDSVLEESIQGDALAASDMRFLMTQMLCMISKNGSPDAKDVTELLGSHDGIREQAEHCLCCWVRRIEENVELGSIILLMGQNALALINETEFYNGSNCLCKIRLTGKPEKNSLLSYLEKKYKVISVYHASGINRSNLEKVWYKKEERALAHRSLLARFSTNEIEKELPALS